MKLRDSFWLWGHPEGRYNNNIEGYGCPHFSRMTPMEGCLYLGISNTFMTPCGWPVNRRQYNKSFKTLNKVGWDFCRKMDTPELIEDFIAEAKEFPNINCVVFDDFKGLRKKYEPEAFRKNLINVMDRLHNNDVRRLDSWMVLYTREFGLDKDEDAELKDTISYFDGVIMWNWFESQHKDIPDKFEIFKELTPGKKRMFGCYLYNFGERKQATGTAVKWQLDFYRDRIIAGEAEGVVLHTNTMADLDYEAYDACLEWMDKYGDEEVDIPSLK